MKQIPLPVEISQYMTFESFFVGQNSALIDALNAQDQKLIWITAETGNGKTHKKSSLCTQYE